jgi:hypothetical protein
VGYPGRDRNEPDLGFPSEEEASWIQTVVYSREEENTA